MPIKVLVINSSADKNNLLTQVFKELEQKNFSFSLWSSEKNLIGQFIKNRWPAKKIYLGPNLKNKRQILFFAVFLLFFQLKCLAYLVRLKIRRQVNLIVCLNFNEKFIITGPAGLLGLKTVWLESPEINYRQINRGLLGLYRLNYRLAKIITFNNFAKLQLGSLGFKEKGLKMIPPGVKPHQYQENIFNKLAVSSQKNFRRKYFTIGAITDLNQKQKIETVFQAIKSCRPVIANLQLIIIGEGRERKNLLWLAKKMEIDNLVWLVGQQEQPKKWLENFDLFLAAGDSAKLDDYGHILEAMAAGLPVLAPRNIGLEDLVIENKTGCLIDPDNNEMLFRLIIKLHQDKKMRLFLGKNGRERVNQAYLISQTAAKLEQMLNN